MISGILTRIMTSACKSQVAVGKFQKNVIQECCHVQYIQGGTCLSWEHNVHVEAPTEETSQHKRS